MIESAIIVGRLRRKLIQRDQRIAGLERRISTLESELATAHIDAKRTPGDVRRAVQDALCNVRMIPVIGVGGSDRIIEVKATKTGHLQDYPQEMAELKRRIKDEPGFAKSLLRDAGIINEDGTLAERFGGKA